jgi:5-methylcytosine-specific restriction endonuclease McrA
LNGLEKVISTILKHERKQTSYKIALVRAINDVALSFPDLRPTSGFIALPLRLLAEYWLAYYWPFAEIVSPIFQGVASSNNNDLSFRKELTNFRSLWEGHFGLSGAAEGFLVRAELRLPRKRTTYPQPLVKAYDALLAKMCRALVYPIQYAGATHWSIFTRPAPYEQLASHLQTLPLAIHPLPGTTSADLCILLESALWRTFLDMSLWVEALCIHEWSIFTERIQPKGNPVSCSHAYGLLTTRPNNRRPLTWERNQVDLLMMQGTTFTCPWTFKTLNRGQYDMDHIIPIAVYPVNELWNLVPADSQID